MSESSVTTKVTGSLHVPDQVMALAERLSTVHGTVVITNEANGFHLNMASPVALENDGSVELLKRHLAVNASRYLGIGKFANRSGDVSDREMAGYCMKYRIPYNVYELLYNFPTLADRGIKESGAKVVVAARERKLVDDGKGNMIPPPPGVCVPLSSLPGDHPAIWYLKDYRGYDIATLERQFRASWCVQELPQAQRNALDIYYKPLPGGFANTPQGRIIFFADMYGVEHGWQGRVLSFSQDGKQYYLHPYTFQWVHCENFNEETGKWEPVPQFATSKIKWEMQRYKTSDYMARAEVIFGLDAAIAWNEDKVIESCVLTEGPLDAGRPGPPGVCMVGGFLSEQQADILNNRFRTIWYVADMDAPGQKTAEKVRQRLAGKGLRELSLPAGNKKDLGDLSNESAKLFLAPVYIHARGFDV